MQPGGIRKPSLFPLVQLRALGPPLFSARCCFTTERLLEQKAAEGHSTRCAGPVARQSRRTALQARRFGGVYRPCILWVLRLCSKI